MSLEIAATNGKYAVIVSDGLEWNGETGEVLNEHSRKHVELGERIVIAGGGYAHEMRELFFRCKEAYDSADRNAAAQLEAVKREFSQVFSERSFPGFGKTCMGGILVARDGDGFVLIKQHAGGEPEVHHVKAGDEPIALFCGPGTAAEMPAFMFLGNAAIDPMRSGASPEQVVENLRELYRAASQLGERRTVNTNLRVAVLWAEPEPAVAPDGEWTKALWAMVEKTRAEYQKAGWRTIPAEASGALANNAITANGAMAMDSPQSLDANPPDPRQIGSGVTISTKGGYVIVQAKLERTAYTAGTQQSIFQIRKDSTSGTILDQIGNATNTVSYDLLAVDTSPAASQTYVLCAYMGTGELITVNHARLVCMNGKK